MFLTVKWFNVKNKYSFINLCETHEDTFVHQAALTQDNVQKIKQSAGEGEIIAFDIVFTEKEPEAANVTVPDVEPVQSSTYAVAGVHGYPLGEGRSGGSPTSSASALVFR